MWSGGTAADPAVWTDCGWGGRLLSSCILWDLPRHLTTQHITDVLKMCFNHRLYNMSQPYYATSCLTTPTGACRERERKIYRETEVKAF